jgi:hypothetical protein
MTAAPTPLQPRPALQPLPPMRLPADPWPGAIAVNAHRTWRLTKDALKKPALESGNPGEEFKSVSEFMRLYSTLRFYQLALLLGTTGSIVSALSSSAVRSNFARAEFLKAAGLVVGLAFLVMEFRASSYWHRLRDRGNTLAEALRYEAFPTASRWNPLTTSGAGLYLHVFVSAMWFASLFFRLQLGL